MRSVYLIAEGPGDLGSLGDETAVVDREGALQPLIRRLLPLHEIDFEPTKDSLSFFDIPQDVEGKYHDKAMKAVAVAASYGWDLVVIHADADARSDKAGRPAAAFKETRAALLSGAAAAEEPQVGFAAAVPIRMTEAWLLADTAAVAAIAAGGALAAPPGKAGKPEQLGGSPRDPDSDYPKHVLKRLLGYEATSEVQADLAGRVDLATVEQRCSESFAPFAEELREASKYWAL